MFSGTPAAADPIRGVTISCPRSGQIWGTDATVRSMARLKKLGATWVTIHPYARVHADGGVGRGGLRPGEEAPRWLRRPIRAAHRLELKILIKPHLAYWGSPFSWRGAIEFDTEKKWRRFFRTYRAWITQTARLTSDADGFAVGTELQRSLSRERAWRNIIADVRAATDAPLTYAAHWEAYRDVPFWDALDAIGIQAYFPLTKEKGLPSRASLRSAWKAHIERIEAYSRAQHKPVVFTELGYNRSALAARKPWSARSGGPHAATLKRRCLSIALEAVERAERVHGAFLWKWFPRTHERETFRLNTSSMRPLLRKAWGKNHAPATRP
jgi:hypothetical protein